MIKLFENDDLYALYKEKARHTLSDKDSSKDDTLCLYRLDECTSGILVYAKNEDAFNALKELQADDKILKTYVAECKENNASELINPKLRERFLSRKNTLSQSPFEVKTYFRPFGEGRKAVRCVFENELEKYKHKDVTKRPYLSKIVDFNNCVFRVEITKGFRHQIRAHLATLGFPIVNDTMYGYNNTQGVRSPSIALECVKVRIGDLTISMIENNEYLK